jgi:serine/threonine protein kinase
MKDDFDRGRMVGKYEILTRLSVGGMAELYLAVLPGPGGFKKFVALKQILPDARNDEEFVKMFLDEARITAQLNHPNIGQVFDLGRDEASGELFLAMEFIAGQDLEKLSRAAAGEGVLLPLAISCRIVRDACLALNAAHAFVDPTGHRQPIVHRDVAPKNVMISYAGHVKVIDFGIAKARGRLARTQVGLVRGTLPYMSPEQLLDLPLDGRTDLFSLGIVLHELLTGERLYPNNQASVMRVIEEAPPDPCQKNPAIPRALGDVALKALAKKPEDRFQTATEFARALEGSGPKLADEATLAAFIGGLFAEQLKSSRALFEAVQHEADPGRLSGLVQRMTSTELPPVTAPQERVPPLASAPGSTGTPWIIGVVSALALATVAFVAWNSAVPPASEVPSVSPPRVVPVVGAQGRVRQGQAAMAAKNDVLAAENFEAAVVIEPSNWDALQGAGVAARRLGNFQRARQRLEAAAACARSPRDAAATAFELGCALAALGQSDAALASLEKAVGLVGLSPFAEALASEKDLAPLRDRPAFQALGGNAAPTRAEQVGLLDDVAIGQRKRERRIDVNLGEMRAGMKGERRLQRMFGPVVDDLEKQCNAARTLKALNDCEDEVNRVFTDFSTAL